MIVRRKDTSKKGDECSTQPFFGSSQNVLAVDYKSGPRENGFFPRHATDTLVLGHDVLQHGTQTRENQNLNKKVEK